MFEAGAPGAGGGFKHLRSVLNLDWVFIENNILYNDFVAAGYRGLLTIPTRGVVMPGTRGRSPPLIA